MYSHKATNSEKQWNFTDCFYSYYLMVDVCMWYAGACVSWGLTAANSYKETTVIQYIMHNRPVETVTGDAFELIKSSKTESVLQNLWTLYLQGHTYRGLWLQTCMISYRYYDVCISYSLCKAMHASSGSPHDAVASV